ncbi:MAG TPA: hypothetical protein VGO11_02340 [Chthoniobacteraceae bacterium]|nr:hypothetical protein [Chthoniobacteraceae bacterium]
MKRFPLPPWLGAVFLLAIPATGLPAEPTPPARTTAETIPLEEIPQRVTKLEEGVARAWESAQLAVEEEARAGRISKTAAQSLRETFGLDNPTAYDLRGTIAAAPVPPENARLTTLKEELEAANQRMFAGRAELAEGAKKEIRRRVVETLRTASKPEEIDAVIVSIRLIDGIRGPTKEIYLELPQLAAQSQAILRTLQRLLVAQAAGEQGATALELANLRQQVQANSEIGAVREVEARRQAILAPAQMEAERTRETLDTAIQQRKPATELSPLLAAHLTTLARSNDLRPPNQRNPGASPHDRAARGYVYLFGLLARLEKGFPITQSEIDAGQPALDGMEARSAGIFKELIKTWQQDQGGSIRKRLAAAQKPADLDQIVNELAAWEREESTGPCAQYLKTLAICWSNPSPALYEQVRELEGPSTGSTFAPEAAQLKERVARDVLSRLLHAPELKTPPLRDLPAAAAVEKLCDNLAAKGEWRRLYEVLRAREPLGREELQGRPDDAVSALHAFLAAQNLELGEQWPEAAHLYREVLQNPSARAPVKAATERLKAMKQEHPDAFKRPK